MCDAQYNIFFDEGKAKVIEDSIIIDGRIVMQGQRDRGSVTGAA
jgi:hypothetical protein